MDSRSRPPTSLHIWLGRLLLVGGAVFVAAACGSRTDILPGGVEGDPLGPTTDVDGQPSQPGDPSKDPPPVTTTEPPDEPPVDPPVVEPPPDCEPAPEECNGVDDDCDGQTDEVSAIPCPDGGFRYCINGQFSECPQRCESCVPGSERVCFVAYCTYWGVQTCAADGRGFSACREIAVPSACKSVASEHAESPELEQCCVDNGYCCRDEFDLDHDGSTTDVVGRCEDVSCN